jgi:hypothetical protein
MNMIATMGLELDCGGGVVLILIVVFVAAAAAAVRLDVWYRRLLGHVGVRDLRLRFASLS